MAIFNRQLGILCLTTLAASGCSESSPPGKSAGAPAAGSTAAAATAGLAGVGGSNAAMLAAGTSAVPATTGGTAAAGAAEISTAGIGGEAAVSAAAGSSAAGAANAGASNAAAGSSAADAANAGAPQAGAEGRPRFAFCPGADRAKLDFPDESASPDPVIDAGFFDIEAVTYQSPSIINGALETNTSEPARLFYSFVPAEVDPKHAPVFLIFNGGPGASTMSNLRVHGSAPKLVNAVTGAIEDNPYSWTRLANLLYVDERQAGFSYSVKPAEAGVAGSSVPAVYSHESFNQYLDAADYVRALLGLYDRFPTLDDNPVVVVGESYGGIRAQFVLNALRDPTDLTTGANGRYVDPSLAASLLEHERRVAARLERNNSSPRSHADQYAWQMLIEPALISPSMIPSNYSRLANGLCPSCVTGIQARATDLGISLTSGYYPYQINLSLEEGLAQGKRTIATLLEPEGFTQLLGLAPERIAGMQASTRVDASKLGRLLTDTDPDRCAVPSAEWTTRLGDLGKYDCYFTPLSTCASSTNFYFGEDGWVSGKLFLRNLRGVHSFITRALLDVAVVTDAIALQLSTFIPGVYSANPYGVESDPDALLTVATDLSSIDGAARPGHIEVNYAKASGTPSGNVRRIRFPTYANAGHEVAYASPRELLEDMTEFLCSWE